jgi:hypothetical protein
VDSGGNLSIVYVFKDDGLGAYYNDQGLCYFNGALFLPRMTEIWKIDSTKNNSAQRLQGVFVDALNCVSDKNGIIYYVDVNGRPNVVMVDNLGNVVNYFTYSNNRPFAVQYDSNGNMLVASKTAPKLLRRNTDGTASSLAILRVQLPPRLLPTCWVTFLYLMLMLILFTGFKIKLPSISLRDLTELLGPQMAIITRLNLVVLLGLHLIPRDDYL